MKPPGLATSARTVADILVEMVLTGSLLAAADALLGTEWNAGRMLVAGACWLAAIVLSRMVGRRRDGMGGLSYGVLIGLPIVLVLGINGWQGEGLAVPRLLYVSFLVAGVIWLWRGWAGWWERHGGDRHAEALRVLVVAAAAVWPMRPFFTDLLVGGTDARWYGGMFTDFSQQLRAGVFPIFLGQGPYAFNGPVNLFRTAPVCLWFGGLWDWITLQSLPPLALQHLSIITSELLGAIGMYVALLLLSREFLPNAERSSWQRWLAALVAALYPLCPGILTTIYWYELQMTLTAVAFLPWVFYGNVRTLIRPDGRGYAVLAAALVLTWMSHAPLAMLCTLITAAIQVGRLIFDSSNFAHWRAAATGAILFVLLGAYYFQSMGEVPSENLQPLLYQEGVLLCGLTLVVAGMVRAFAWRQWPALLLAAGGAALVWRGMPVWVIWTAGFAVVFGLTAVGAEWSRPGWVRQQAPLVTVLATLAAAGLAHFAAAWFGFRPEEFLLVGLKANAAVAGRFFAPLSSDLTFLSTTQPGAVLWLLLAVGLVGGIWLRSLPVTLLSMGAIPLLLMLVPLPWVSDFIVGFAPEQISTIVTIPLPYRLVPPMAAMAAMAGFLTILLASRRHLIWTRMAVLLLLPGVAWSVWETRFLVARGWAITSTPAATEMLYNRDNYALGRYCYVLNHIPAYFSNGREEPQLETRLLDAQRKVVVGPDEIARCCEETGSDVITLHCRAMPNASDWLEISPNVPVEAGERLLLRFEFPPNSDCGGWLILSSEHNYREYDLINEPACPLGFGAGPQASRVISFFNDRNSRENYRISMKVRPGNSMPRNGEAWAKVTISRYRSDWVPVRTESLIPYYQSWVSANEAGFVESPRVWVPGYRAWVDGRPAKAMESPQHLVMVPISAGTHTVRLKFVGSFRLWTGLLASTLTWVGVGLWLVGGGKTRWVEMGARLKKALQHLVLRRQAVTGGRAISYRVLLAAIVLASLGLRVLLATRGGEGYWPDEGRFGRSSLAVQAVVDGDWRAARGGNFWPCGPHPVQRGRIASSLAGAGDEARSGGGGFIFQSLFSVGPGHLVDLAGGPGSWGG